MVRTGSDGGTIHELGTSGSARDGAWRGGGVGWLCGAVGAVTACDEHDLYTTRIQKRRGFT